MTQIRPKSGPAKPFLCQSGPPLTTALFPGHTKLAFLS